MDLINFKNILISFIFCFLFAENSIPQDKKSDLSIIDTSIISIKNKAQYFLNIADSLYNNNEDLESIEYFENALELFQIIDDSSNVDYCYFHIGKAYYLIDNERTAINYFYKTLSYKDPKNTRFIQRYYYLSDSYFIIGEIDSSIHYIQKAHELSIELKAFDWILDIEDKFIEIYYSVTYGSESVGPEKFINNLKESADLFAGRNPNIAANNYHTIGTMYWDSEDHDKAIQSYEKSKKLWVKYVPDYQDSLTYFHLVEILNELYHLTGNYDSLLAIQGEIINLSNVSKTNTIEERSRIDMMVKFYSALGRDTEIFYDKYNGLRKKIRKKYNPQQYTLNHLDLARFNQELAFTFEINIDQTDSAKYFWEKSLEYFQSVDINNIPSKSMFYDGYDDFTRNAVWYNIMNARIKLAEAALQLSDSLLNQNVTDYNLDTFEQDSYDDEYSYDIKNLYITSLGMLGTTAIGREDYDKAIEYFEMALNLKPVNASWTAEDFSWIGYCYYFKKDYTKSIYYFKKELKINKKHKMREDVLSSYYSVGESYYMDGQFNKSVTYLDSAIHILDNLLYSLKEQNKINLLDKHISIIQLQIYNYYNLKDKPKLLNIIEKYRSLVLKDRLALDIIKSDFNLEIIQSSLNEDECIILFANVDMTSLYFTMKNTEIIHPIIIYIDSDNMLIEKVIITDTNETETRIDKTLELNIKILIKNSIIQKSSALNIYQKRLYNDFFGPFEHLLDKKKKINIMAEGSLYLLPFELLVDRNGHYLANSFDINYISSLQLFISKSVRDYSVQKGGKVLAIGSPKFSEYKLTNKFLNDQNVHRNLVLKMEANQNIDQEFVYLGYTEWDSLPGALEELNTISEIFNDVNILTSSDANELSVKVLCDLNDYDIIHFATHSVIIDDIPQASSIILSSSQTINDDGYLNINEISKLNIESSFINLASCESGVGEILPGQGIYSFTQAFEHAGAQSVLVSLWPIDDYSTSVFMNSFYRKIASGYVYDNALAEVKREFINGLYGEEYKKPYYWAPFVYYGK